MVFYAILHFFILKMLIKTDFTEQNLCIFSSPKMPFRLMRDGFSNSNQKILPMKHSIKLFSLLMMAAVIVISCKKETKISSSEISDETISQIRSLGFSTENVQVIEEGWLVEGDIVITPSMLNERPTSPTLRIAEVEQYRTFNLVNGLPRTITVSSSGSVNTAVSNAINAAISRYNAENLSLTFQRVASNGDINIKIVNGGPYIASAGFPSGGDPYGEVKFNKQYQNYSSGFLTTVIAHEMGHCIGFRHTDYMNRAFSCGSGGNEGSGSVGAVHIPGTPTGPDSGSWMLACLSSTTNRPFNNNDKTALNYLY